MKTNTKEKSYAKVTGGGVTYRVLDLLNNGLYAKQIADELKKSKTSVHRHIKKLLKHGYIAEEVRSTYKSYNITNEGKTALRNKKLRGNSCISTKIKLGGHLRIYIPIIRHGNLPQGFWTKINNRFKNSYKKHRDLHGIIDGVSVAETTKGIEVNVKHRTLGTMKEIYPLIRSTVDQVSGFFMAHGYTLDTKNHYVSDTHNTVHTKEVEDVARKSGRVVVTFPWNRKKITPRDPGQQAKTWFDKTPKPNLETNDMSYEEAFIRMPVNVGQMVNLMEEQAQQMATYAEHLNAHIPVLKGMEKLIRKLDKKISQRSLNEFA